MTVVTVFSVVLFALLVLSIISLATRHTLLGMALPANVPMWAAVVLVLFVYFLVASPLHAS